MMKLGFVGLGVMGSRLVKRLLGAGYTVTGYNRTKDKADGLIAQGMRWVETPNEVAQTSDIIFSMVTDTKAVEAVTQGDAGIIAGLSKSKLYIDMSTMSPSYSRTLAEQVRAKGAQMLDAPVSGSVATLEAGKLSIMVGGERSAFERALPVLQTFGPTVNHVGGNGLAVSMKIALNLGLAVQMLAFSETVLLAEKSGIAREKAIAVVLASVVASPMVQYRGPFALAHPEGGAWFDCTMMQKDVGLALELGRSLGVPLPTTSVTNEYLTAARSMGLGQQDFAVLFDVLAGLANVTTPRLEKGSQG